MSLTSGEQYLLELINRARLDPAAEAARYNLDLNAGLAAGTIGTKALQVLAPNASLESAATGHSGWMLATDSFSHTGAGGTSAGDRIQGAGYQFNGQWGWRENLAWVGSTGAIDEKTAIAQHHEGLYRSESHRVNTFAEDMREIGIGQTAGQFSYGGRTYNSSMLTQNFAQSGDTTFVTGVAYRDMDRDGFYSVGEGQGGVWVRSAGSTDVTAATGGYGIAVTAQDNLRVDVGIGGTRLAQLAVDTSDGNVKVDVVTQAGGGRLLELSGTTTMMAGIGNARLLGAGDIDLTGHGGANRLIGNMGDNVIWGRGGNDVIFGGGGNDWLIGGEGNDRMSGGAAADQLAGNNGIDRLFGDGGNDRIMAGHGNDLAAGGSGRDFIFGQGGNDRIWGNDGDDVLHGNAGNDLIWGGPGNDMLDGGAGNDAMAGGAGADMFVFSAGRDRITDFTDDVDRLFIREAGLGDGNLSVAEVLGAGRIVGGNAVFDFGGGDVLTLSGIGNLDILANDIIII